MKATQLNELDQVEILTLQDNFIDVVAFDGNAMIRRAMSLVKGEIRNSILAEHGFSAVIRTTTEDRTRTMLFDFGFSEIGAAYNARALEVPMEEIEAVALSHGHSDHTGGFRELMTLIGRPGIEFVVHPAAFKANRYLKFGEVFKARFPRFTREEVNAAGAKIVETKDPLPMLAGNVLFLGEIPRLTDFEKGMPNAYYEEESVEKKDHIEDDTSIVMRLKGKGLIILSGCAHAGIVNTVRYAREAAGTEAVHAIMGGFHLNGPLFEPIVDPTIEALQAIDPRYIIPTHCTGRKSIRRIEDAMPDRFVLNMAGTSLTFTA